MDEDNPLPFKLPAVALRSATVSWLQEVNDCFYSMGLRR